MPGDLRTRQTLQPSMRPLRVSLSVCGQAGEDLIMRSFLEEPCRIEVVRGGVSLSNRVPRRRKRGGDEPVNGSVFAVLIAAGLTVVRELWVALVEQPGLRGLQLLVGEDASLMEADQAL